MRRFYWLFRSSPMVRYGATHGIAIGVVIGILIGALADYLHLLGGH